MDHVIEAKRQRTEVWKSYILLAVLFVAGTVGVAFSHEFAWQGLVAYGIAILAMGLVAALASLFLRRDRFIVGFLILMLVINAHTIINTFFIQDYAVLFLGFAVLIVWLQSRHFVSNRWLLTFLALTALVGLTMVLLDFFALPVRPYDRLGRIIAAAIAGLVLIYAIWQIFGEYRDYPLRTKLITATLFAAIISIGVNIIISVQLSSIAVTEDIGRDLERLADSEALGVSEFLARQIDVLNSLTLNGTIPATLATADQTTSFPLESSDPLLQGLFANNLWRNASANDTIVNSRLQNGATNALVQFQDFFVLHKQILVIDLDANLMAATDRPELFYFGEQNWWVQSFNSGLGRPYIGNPVLDEASNVLWVDLAVPIREPQSGDLVGILYSQYDLKELLEVLHDRDDDIASGEIELIVNNQLFGSSGDSLEIVVLETGTTMGMEIGELNEFVVSDFQGESSFVAMSELDTLGHVPAIDELDWGVLVHQPEAIALQPVNDQTRVTVLVGLGILLFTTIIASYVAGLIAQPIVKLTETAVRVADGDLTARAEATTRDELGVLSTSFNIMTDELERSVQDLGVRVAERTRALELSTQVGRKLTTILDTDELLRTLVDEVQRAFNYYHVQVYLRDRNTNRLVLRGATGAVGETLLKQGHTLLIGQGIVGQAAARLTASVVPDVSKSNIWFPNELLQDTKSEMAVPITVGEQLLGVLNIQHDLLNGLSERDVSTIETIAAQVATALQNARSYERARNQAAQEALINEISQKIQSATDVDGALQIAVRELGRALGKAQTRATLYPAQKSQTKELRPASGNGSFPQSPDAKLAEQRNGKE